MLMIDKNDMIMQKESRKTLDAVDESYQQQLYTTASHALPTIPPKDLCFEKQ